MPPVKTARPTPSSRPSRTARRLLKVAGLGVAGLIAGLLAGCSSSGLHFFNRLASEQPTLTASRRIENLESKRIPALRHAPLPHYNRPMTPGPHQAALGQPDPTLTAANYHSGHYSYAISSGQ